LEAAKRGRGVAVFSLEMGREQLLQRIASMETGIPAGRIKRGKITMDEFEQVGRAIQLLSSLPIHIDDTAALNIFELRAKARRMKMQHGIGLLIVDYLQLMSAGDGERKGSGNREQEVSAISRGLKHLAKELEVPVIALSQLSRAVEIRGGSKRPQLSDLRESGSLEQDADLVAFLYRPEYYGIMEDESGKSTAGVTELLIEKHRHGALDTVGMIFDGPTTKFYDVSARQSTQFPTTAPQPGQAFSMPRPENDQDIPF
jgi:replicative DNA helicase